MKKTLSRFLPYIRLHKGKFVQAGFAMLVVALFKSGTVLLLKYVIDDVSILKDKRTLIAVVVLIPTVFFLKMIAQYTQAYLMSWIGQKTVQIIREDLFCHLHKLSVEFYWRKRLGEIMTRVTNDLVNLQSALQFLPLYFVRDTLTLLALLGMLFYINWRFTLIALLLGPIAGAVLGVLGKKMRKAATKSQAISGQIYHRFHESLGGMAIVKAFNYEQKAIQRFQTENDALFSQMMRYLRATALSGPLMEFLGSIVIAMLLYFGGVEMLSGRMTAGSFAAFLVAFFIAYDPLKNIIKANPTFQLAVVSWGRILHLLDEKPSVVEMENPISVPTLKGEIVFENVCYQYPSGRKNAIENFSLTIKPGESVAFVGPSGSGKTTLINLLLRLFDPTSGRILYDGNDLKEVNLGELRDHIGLVSQNTILFDDSVETNISLGRPTATFDEVVEAAKIADAHDFIEHLSAGYDTMLGERGVKLSGGQRQRLAIARAVLKKPSVLLLDEATSNLDTTSEKAVQHSIEKILGQGTAVMVAHRLSTIKNADKICVLHQGKLEEMGTHDELIKLNGIYKKLNEIQQIAS
jgi:ATP-binding cassette, subfamily B, bacterial MsbA